MSFTGFPVAAFDFYDDLEIDNTKSFWEAPKQQYSDAVKTPMTELMAALADEFGPAKIFRPYRDVRFAKDKTPYKTHQGAFVRVAPACGFYAEIAAPGFRVGAGFYQADAPGLARIRGAIDDQRQGGELEALLAKASTRGFELGGEQLKTAPRGWDTDHPRIALLRHKSMTLGKSYGFNSVIHTPELIERVRDDWRSTRPLVEWFGERLNELDSTH